MSTFFFAAQLVTGFAGGWHLASKSWGTAAWLIAVSLICLLANQS